MSLDKYLEEIRDANRPLVAARLTRLSNLSPEDRNTLASYWPTIEAARKVRLAKSVYNLAEDNVELDFEAVFRLCLDDRSPAVRVAGIEGLVESTDRWLMDRLILMLRDDEVEEVRAAAASALGRFALQAELGELRTRDANKVDEVLLSAFQNESESVVVRRRAIESLGVRLTETVASAIAKSYASGEHELRVGAIFAMGRSCDERWLNTVLQELKSADPEMRYEAVNACGEMENQQAVPYLIPLLQDDDTQVRLSTVAALGHIGGPRAKQEILRCLTYPDEQMRAAAEEALEELSFHDDPLTLGLYDTPDS